MFSPHPSGHRGLSAGHRSTQWCRHEGVQASPLDEGFTSWGTMPTCRPAENNRSWDNAGDPSDTRSDLRVSDSELELAQQGRKFQLVFG